MYIKHFTLETTIIAAACSLAWFLLGIVIGRLQRNQPARGRTSRAPRRQNGGDVVELYVGNLSYDVSERDLEKMFDSFGSVVSTRVIKNRFSDRSKGFGFVEMADRSQANAAISAMHNKEIKGRKMVVNEAKSRSRR